MHKKQDEIKKEFAKRKKKGKKIRKDGEEKKEKEITVSNLMNKTGLHCHAAFVSVLGKPLVCTELGHRLDKRD